ncbi:carboxypeptidase-like regulatory domain-containing protein [uncultured Draconibacterium sp.]|uniref:carboxypeptidase-like regulatory domain-containing protein n=1 Tax=uncultured Draconibacterium sp. TaxID=1573823 RepID=UPI0029C8BDB1|nr:carboxypeptidase-like regulatory domain-containing protein [uncultured Draconibacterium sp.]
MRYTAFISLLFILLVACEKDEYPGVIRGNVLLTDHYDSFPIKAYDDNSGIIITLSDINGTITKTLSDEEGNYELLNIRPGEFKLRFEKDSFSFYEIFDINIEGADTIDLTYSVNQHKLVRLLKLQPLTFKTVKAPYISSYKGGIQNGPYEGQFGLIYDIVTEIEQSRSFGCVAFISTEEDVDYMNYQMAIGCSNMSRYYIENRILEFNFHDLDRELFPLSTKIYIHYYPVDGGPVIYDPWLDRKKYCTMHFNNSKKVSFTIPGNSMYYDGSPL